MSVNLKYAINEEKVKHLGKYIHSIDFEVVTPNKTTLERLGGGTVAGKLSIGNKEFELTLAELDRISETCQIAKQVFNQKYKFGM